MKSFKRTGSIFLIIAALVCSLLVMTGCSKEISVEIADGNTKTVVKVQEGKTVADVLNEAGIAIGENDTVAPAMDSKITGEVTAITVTRPITVTISEAGNTKEVTFNGTTVQQALDAAGIPLGNDDAVVPGLTEAVNNGDTIEIKRTVTEEIVEKEKIPFATQETYSSAMFQGESAVVQEGKKGLKEITYKVTYIDGKESGREVVSEKVVREPVDKVISYGTGQYTAPEPQPQPQPGGKVIVSQENFPNCADGSHGYTEITYSDGSKDYVTY